MSVEPTDRSEIDPPMARLAPPLAYAQDVAMSDDAAAEALRPLLSRVRIVYLVAAAMMLVVEGLRYRFANSFRFTDTPQDSATYSWNVVVVTILLMLASLRAGRWRPLAVVALAVWPGILLIGLLLRRPANTGSWWAGILVVIPIAVILVALACVSLQFVIARTRGRLNDTAPGSIAAWQIVVGAIVGGFGLLACFGWLASLTTYPNDRPWLLVFLNSALSTLLLTVGGVGSVIAGARRPLRRRLNGFAAHFTLAGVLAAVLTPLIIAVPTVGWGRTAEFRNLTLIWLFWTSALLLVITAEIEWFGWRYRRYLAAG